MKKTKRKALEAAGRRVGTAEEFLEQSGKCFFCKKFTPESFYCYGCNKFVCERCEPPELSHCPSEQHTHPSQHTIVITMSLAEYRKLKKPRKPR